MDVLRLRRLPVLFLERVLSARDTCSLQCLISILFLLATALHLRAACGGLALEHGSMYTFSPRPHGLWTTFSGCIYPPLYMEYRFCYHWSLMAIWCLVTLNALAELETCPAVGF